MASMSKSVAASAFKRSAPRPRKRGRQKSPHLSAALTAPRLRALHCAEHIGSAFKGGVNVCQRQLVNEVLGPLVTEFVPNFGREGATPIQRGSNASLLHRVQAVKIIRHNTSRIFRAAHIESWVAYCAQQVQRFDLDQTFWCRGASKSKWLRWHVRAIREVRRKPRWPDRRHRHLQAGEQLHDVAALQNEPSRVI